MAANVPTTRTETPPSQRRLVLDAVSGGATTSVEVSRTAGIDKARVSSILYALFLEGMVRRTGYVHGMYRYEVAGNVSAAVLSTPPTPTRPARPDLRTLRAYAELLEAVSACDGLCKIETAFRDNLVWALRGAAETRVDLAAPTPTPYGSEILCEHCAKVFCPHGEDEPATPKPVAPTPDARTIAEHAGLGHGPYCFTAAFAKGRCICDYDKRRATLTSAIAAAFTAATDAARREERDAHEVLLPIGHAMADELQAVLVARNGGDKTIRHAIAEQWQEACAALFDAQVRARSLPETPETGS